MKAKWVFLAVTSGALFLGSCLASKRAGKPLVVEVSNKGYESRDSYYRVYYVGPLRMFETHYLFDSTRVYLDSLGNASREEVLGREVRTRFLVFHKDSVYGLRFDASRESENPERVLLDSVLRIARIRFTSEFDSLVYAKPVSTTWNAEKTEKQEVFVTRAFPGAPSVKRTLSFSGKMVHIDETFSKKMDSASKMKLFRIEINYDSAYTSEGKLVYFPTNLDHQMRIVEVPESINVNGYIDRYLKVSKLENR